MISIIYVLCVALGMSLLLLLCIYILFPYSIFTGKVRNLMELVTLLFRLKLHALTRNGTTWSFVDDFEYIVDNKEDIIQFIFVENDEHVSRSGLERKIKRDDGLCPPSIAYR